MIYGDLILNNNQVFKSRISKTDIIYCGKQNIEVNTFVEKLPGGKTHNTLHLVQLKKIHHQELSLCCHHHHKFWLND